MRNASCHGGGSVKNTKEACKILFHFEPSLSQDQSGTVASVLGS